MEGIGGLLIVVSHHPSHQMIIHLLRGLVATPGLTMWHLDGTGTGHCLLLLPEVGPVPGPLILIGRGEEALQVKGHIHPIQKMGGQMWMLTKKEGGILLLQKDLPS